MTVSTFYADTADGFIETSDAVYSTSRAGAGFTVDTTGERLSIGQVLVGGVYYCMETFLPFDTSALAGEDVSSAVLGLYGSDDNDASNLCAMEVAAYDFGATVTSADWRDGTALGGLTVRATCAAASFSAAGYFDFTTGTLGEVVVTGGTTRLVVFGARTRTNSTPTISEYVKVWSANEVQAGERRPRLVVTHSTPAAPTTKGFMGCGFL
jgi:hypothetical protein